MITSLQFEIGQNPPLCAKAKRIGVITVHRLRNKLTDTWCARRTGRQTGAKIALDLKDERRSDTGGIGPIGPFYVGMNFKGRRHIDCRTNLYVSPTLKVLVDYFRAISSGAPNL